MKGAVMFPDLVRGGAEEMHDRLCMGGGCVSIID